MSLELLYSEKMEETIIADRLRNQVINNTVSAFCNSVRCSPKQIFNSGKYKAKRNGVFTYVKKNVSRSTTYCPDCGYVLLWKRKI